MSPTAGIVISIVIGMRAFVEEVSSTVGEVISTMRDVKFNVRKVKSTV